MNKFVGFFALMMAFAFPASAAIDLTDVVAVITTDGTAAITAIGGAVASLAALAMVFKWIKGAIFG